MNPRRPRSQLLTFFIAGLAGISIADWVFPEASGWKNTLLAAGVAAAVAVVMAWLGGKRGAPPS